MPRFSISSQNKLNTCDIRLQKIMNEAIETIDFTVLCGHRGKEEQDAAYATGKSKAKWGQSLHNTNPSRAVDIAPYPIDWKDTKRFRALAEHIKRIAAKQEVSIRWGGDFKTLVDMPHFELAE